jgi:protocatechuate 3,4-dioxygenase beta subunit
MGRNRPPACTSSLRRSIVGALAALAVAPAFAQRAREPTPSQTEGPFYPRTLPADRDGALTRVSGRSGRARGTPLYLSGSVLGIDGAPLAGAVVELWQCDANGHYHHVGDRGALDEDFQGYGAVTTGADGRYAFVTIRPVAYPGRVPHMHFKVSHASAAALTTQLYVAGDDLRSDAVAASSPRGALERLTVSLSAGDDREAGALVATFDFVLLTRS